MHELLDCPFCGSKAIAYNDGEDCVAMCTNSDCEILPCVVNKPTVEAAIDVWNAQMKLAAAPKEPK